MKQKPRLTLLCALHDGHLLAADADEALAPVPDACQAANPARKCAICCATLGDEALDVRLIRGMAPREGEQTREERIDGANRLHDAGGVGDACALVRCRRSTEEVEMRQLGVERRGDRVERRRM